MSVVEISSKEQFTSLLSASRLVVADCKFPRCYPADPVLAIANLGLIPPVYADWCGPCKAIAPAYDSLATQLSRPNQITFTKINVDHQQDLAKAYGVTAYVHYTRTSPARPYQTLQAKLDNL